MDFNVQVDLDEALRMVADAQEDIDGVQSESELWRMPDVENTARAAYVALHDLSEALINNGAKLT